MVIVFGVGAASGLVTGFLTTAPEEPPIPGHSADPSETREVADLLREGEEAFKTAKNVCERIRDGGNKQGLAEALRAARTAVEAYSKAVKRAENNADLETRYRRACEVLEELEKLK